ncbi:hypothetical protein A1Q1_06125 [Trichosporon asahii var. asahii CBS 2479]|uniref:Uncharacterized protein n=1 Tax=Trichosporon asahii var. asahii (strain ATCC 90039 / CBS 2479 / JCM 2466 / KCTC 7840 / NBRC 103889/ NCYC 2677 / UAMH 7654) TaxID=1186058 RepID=J6ERL1_TRIAS|nr:hypothetical protein A1Q1_06125 [Trichosporon asahii var. asahii CBS 2479]EJT45362.1 hypothetical protein A1Q1_06125 [Trichosporon asahii var. asahii CBS 2479]
MPAAQRPPASDRFGPAIAGAFAPPSSDRFGAVGETVASDGFPKGLELRRIKPAHAPSSWKPSNDEELPGSHSATRGSAANSRRRQARTSTQSDVIKRPQPEDVPPVPSLTVTGPSSSTSAMALEAPRPIMRHRSSKVRFSSPLRQELKDLDDDEKNSPTATENKGTAELGLTSRPKRSASLAHRNRTTTVRGGGKVIWAKSVHCAPSPNEAGPSRTSARCASSPSTPATSVRRARSTGSMLAPPSEGPRRSPSQRQNAPRRQQSVRKAPPGLWGDLPATGTAPVRSASMGGRPAPQAVNDEPGGVDMSHAPKFSRAGLKRSSVIMPTPKGQRPPTIAIPSKADMDQIRDMNMNSPKEGRPPSCGPSRVGRTPSTRIGGLVRKLSKRGSPGVQRSASTGSRPVISTPVLNDITHMDVPGRPGFKVSLQHTSRGLQLQPVAADPKAPPSSYRPLSTTPTPRTPSELSFRATSTTPTPRTAPTPPPLADTGFSGFQPLRAGPDEEPLEVASATPRRPPTMQMPVPVPTPPKPVPAINAINAVSPDSMQLRAGRVPVHTVPAPRAVPVRGPRPSSHLSTVSGVSGVSRRVSIHDMGEFGTLPNSSTASFVPSVGFMPPSPTRPSTFYASVPTRESIVPEYKTAAPEWEDPALLPSVPQRGSSLLARSVPGSPALKHIDDRAEAHRRSLSGSPRTRSFSPPTQAYFSSPSPTFSPPPLPQAPRVAGTPPAPIGFSAARSNFQSRPRSSLSARRSLTASVPAMLALDEVDEPLPGPESAPLPHTRGDAPHLPPLPQMGPLNMPFSRVAATVGPAGSRQRTSWQRRGHQASASVGTLYDAQRSRTSIRSHRASFHTAHSGMTAESFFTDEASTASTAHPLSTPDLLLADIAADDGTAVGLPDLPATIPQSWSLPQMARLSLNHGPPTEPLPDLPPRFERERAERGDSGRSSEDESTPSLSNDHSQSGQSEEPFGVPLTPPFTPTPLPPEKEVLAEPAGSTESASASVTEHVLASCDEEPRKATRTPVIGYESTGSAASAARVTPSGLELPVRRKVTITRRGAEKISSFPLSTPLVLGDVYQPSLAPATQRHRQDDEWSIASLATSDTHTTHASFRTFATFDTGRPSFDHRPPSWDARGPHGPPSFDTHGRSSFDQTRPSLDTCRPSLDTARPSFDYSADTHATYSLDHGSEDIHDGLEEPIPAFRKRGHRKQSSITSAMSVSSMGHEAAIVEVTRAKTAMAMELRL